MRKVWSCRMHDVDDVGDWRHVDAWTNDEAAKKYADMCDASSGGELFDHNDYWKKIDVRLGDDGKIHTFIVEMEYEKVFYVRAAA